MSDAPAHIHATMALSVDELIFVLDFATEKGWSSDKAFTAIVRAWIELRQAKTSNSRSSP